jgi:hypothetical protein
VLEHLHSVVQILDRGLKTNSYKFALLRALADRGKLGPRGNSIPLDWLAERFLTYYWPLTVHFRVRQATDPTRDPVVMRFIRGEIFDLRLSSNTRLSHYIQKYGVRYKMLLQSCTEAGGCFDEVVPRFHNLRGGGLTPSVLYTYSKDELKLENGVIDFLSGHHRTLELLALGSWVEFTEQFTFAPRLYEKIAGVEPERRHERYRGFLSEIQGGKCFYCQEQHDTPRHVDHVIPWSFVLEDRIWNLVLACRACNSAKSDRTPDDDALRRLVERNRAIIASMATHESAKANLCIKRDLQAFNVDDLEVHIATLISNCRAEGFGIWSRCP